jgi:hypothetical protein
MCEEQKRSEDNSNLNPSIPCSPENSHLNYANHHSEETEHSHRENLILLQRIELSALAIGIFLIIGGVIFASKSVILAIAAGVAFASINFRLLIWSWQPIFMGVPERSSSKKGVIAVLRMICKYLFLFAGIFLLIGGLRLNAVGFVIGLGNVIIGVAIFAPLFFKLSNVNKSQSNG